MGNRIEQDNIVLLLDNYLADSKKLHTSFKLAGKAYPVAVIADDGFLPDDVTSVFGFFLGDFKASPKVPGKPRFFNQIQVPEYWEISGTNSNGKVHDLNKERGRIFYAEPAHKRLVKIVDWLDDRGMVRSSDHYNKYGALYARTIFNAKGQKVNKTYFSADGKEVIMENYVTNDIILNEGNVVKIFHSLIEFVCYFMEKAGLAQKRIFFNTLSTSFFVTQRLAAGAKQDVLFWQEPERPDIPGNMQVILNGNATRASQIIVQNKAAYHKLLELGASKDMLRNLGYIYPFKRENEGKYEALICTNSDRIAQLEKLVEALPELHFHIAAITEMSGKLMSMASYPNVTLYPGVKADRAKELFQKCDYYLDINHEGEILSAVQTAFLHNQLIWGFEDTLHNSAYIARMHIFSQKDVDKMIAELKAVLLDKDLLGYHMEEQHKAALLETAEAYLEI